MMVISRQSGISFNTREGHVISDSSEEWISLFRDFRFFMDRGTGLEFFGGDAGQFNQGFGGADRIGVTQFRHESSGRFWGNTFNSGEERDPSSSSLEAAGSSAMR